MIDKYLISTCLFIIDDFNGKYNSIKTATELKNIAINHLNEAGLVVRLGYPFKDMANFNMSGKAHDIVIDSKDFIIEVKYLRPFKTLSGTYTNKIKWSEAFEKDYNWLCNEIKNGKKGKRAFVLGWFNAYNNFSEIMQLGEGKGQMPDMNKSRINLFPFLNLKGNSNTTEDLFYMYQKNPTPQSLNIVGFNKDVVHCLFLGNQEDKFHFAIYY